MDVDKKEAPQAVVKVKNNPSKDDDTCPTNMDAVSSKNTDTNSEFRKRKADVLDQEEQKKKRLS